MAFLKRIPSVRKKNSYRLAAVSPTERPSSQSVSESAAAKLSSGLIQCHITLLDDSMFTCDLNVRVYTCTCTFPCAILV